MKRLLAAVFPLFAVICLILDAKTALEGACDGISLCIRSVIPALFPYLFLCSLLTAGLSQLRCKNPLFLLLLTGLIGGYPAGAMAVVQFYQAGRLSKQQASRLLPVCNLAGPAFLFGWGMMLFHSLLPCFLIWLIQGLSTLFLYWLNPSAPVSAASGSDIRSGNVMSGACQSMLQICGWVILFRVFLAFLDRWLFWCLPAGLSALLAGFLEMTNGCARLTGISGMGQRLLVMAAIASFGGICVCYQTLSVIRPAGLSLRHYLPGKLFQSMMSLLLSVPAQLLFSKDQRWLPPAWALLLVAICCIVCGFFCRKEKIVVAFRRRILYNKKKQWLVR